MIRTLLVDDHPVVRAGYRRLLECQPQIEVVGEADHCRPAYRLALREAVDVMVTDISLPGMGGLELVRRLQRRRPALRCVVFSMHEERAFVRRAFAAGAQAYVAKRCAPEQLIQAVLEVACGRRYLAPELREAMVAAGTDGVGGLSTREFEVLRQIVDGRSTLEIAQALSLSSKTVANYGTRIRAKLGTQTSADLVRVALAAGVLCA